MSTPIISQPTEQQALFSLMLQYISESVSFAFPEYDKIDAARERGIKFGLRYAAISALLGMPRESRLCLPLEHMPACLAGWTTPRRREFLTACGHALHEAGEHAYSPVANLSFVQRFVESNLLPPNLQQILIIRVRAVLETMWVHPAPTVHFNVCAETCSGFCVFPAIESTDNIIHLCHRILEALGAPLPVEPVIHDDQYQVSVDDLELVGFDAEDEQPQPAALSTQRESDALDAARYHWLRSRDIDTIQHGGVFAGLTPSNVVLNGEDLDKAIDDAMRAGGVA